MVRNISLHKTSLCGYRPSNEDAECYFLNLSEHGLAKDLNYAPIDLFIICDGHGGKRVAEFVVPELKKILIRKKLIYPLSYNIITRIYKGIQYKLTTHPDRIASNCGCTALVLIRYIDQYTNKQTLQIINIGDCRAVLSRNGLAIPLSKDHKPHWPDEKRRIDTVNKNYGTHEKVKFDAGDFRIRDLSVSRAFGDLDNVPFVSYIPDVFTYELTNEDEFVVMACDGVYDVLQNHDVVNFVRDYVQNNHIDLYDIPGKFSSLHNKGEINIARKLAEYAIAKGSMDNVSVFVIFFEN